MRSCAIVASALLCACGSSGGGGSGTGGDDGGGGGSASLPDLLPITVSFQPAAAVAGTPVSVSDTVKNQGGGAAHDFQVAIYLSTDADIGPGDRLLGFRTIGSLAAGASSSGGGSLTLPVSTAAGSYFIGAWVDDAGQVNELTESNNTHVASGSISISIAVLPNLVPQSIAFAPATVDAGAEIQVSDVVLNRGTAAAAAFQVGIYLSSDPDVTTADKLLGLRPVASLAPGAASNAGGFLTIPTTTHAGQYFVGVIVDAGGAVAELDELDNRLVGATALTVTTPPRPDLVVGSVSFSPATVDTGTPIQVEETVLNSGDVDAGMFRVGIYLSTDATMSSADVRIGTRTVADLAVGASSQATTECLVPVELAGGRWFVGVLVDSENDVGELDESNNALAAATSITLTVPPRPDLVVTSITFQPSQVDADLGQTIHATELVKNVGTFAAGAFRVGVYLSANDVITSSDILLGWRDVTVLGIGDGSAAASDFVVPSGLSPGTYFVGAIADDTDAQIELLESNNVLAAGGTIDVISTPDPMPNLIVHSVTFSPQQVLPGGIVQVQSSVRNEGNLSAGAFKVGIYLSSDEEISVDDRRIGERTVFQLGIGFGSASSAPYSVPASVPPGDYFVGAVADRENVIQESDEDDNSARAPGKLRIYVPPPPAPDLVVASVAFTSEGTSPTRTVRITSAVSNLGALPAGAFQVGYYLSVDDAIGTGDILLGVQTLSGLSAEQSFNGTASFDVPATIAPGTYRVAAFADDASAVAEGDETNNTKLATGTLTLP